MAGWLALENTSLCLGEGAGLLAGSLLQESALISYRSQLLAALAGRAFCDVDCMEKVFASWRNGIWESVN